MEFSFEVGTDERHRVDFSFNQIVGNLKISVDGVPHKRDFRFASVSLIKRYEFTVGLREKHHVLIEKERRLLLAGFRKQKYRVFVDGQFMQEHEGY